MANGCDGNIGLLQKFLRLVRCQRESCRCLGCIPRRCRFNGVSVSGNSEVVSCQRCGVVSECPQAVSFQRYLPGENHFEAGSAVAMAFVLEEFGDTQYRSSGACLVKIPRQCHVPMVFSRENFPPSERQELGRDPGEVVRKTALIVPALTVSLP